MDWGIYPVCISFLFGLSALFSNQGYFIDHSDKVAISGITTNIWNFERAYRIVATTYNLPKISVLLKGKPLTPLIEISNTNDSILKIKLKETLNRGSKFIFDDRNFLVFPSPSFLTINNGDYKVTSHLIGWLANALVNDEDELSLIESARVSGNWHGNLPQTFTALYLGNYCLENAIQKNDLNLFECSKSWLGRANLNLRSNFFANEPGSVSPEICVGVVNNFAISNLATIKEKSNLQSVLRLFEIALKCGANEEQNKIVRYNLAQIKSLIE